MSSKDINEYIYKNSESREFIYSDLNSKDLNDKTMNPSIDLMNSTMEQWELVPQNLPVVRRNCPKCNEKTHFINTQKFRVNANKSNIDIWLIYQCENCKSTWNLTIYERINPSDISNEIYERFLANDTDLARDYGFDLHVHARNRAELILDDVTYTLKVSNRKSVEKSTSELRLERSINQDRSNKQDTSQKETVIQILSKYNLDIRVDKLLSDNLGISRGKVKKMYESQLIYSEEYSNLLKMKVKDGMLIYLKEPIEEVKEPEVSGESLRLAE
jgi:hypothetical protein